METAMTQTSDIRINRDEYRNKVMGCWLGKAVGGTLGQPHEGNPGPLELTFYDPVPKGAIPNDDLDLQVLWAEVADRFGPAVDRTHLAKGWIAHTDFPWDEYGVATANIARGIMPPLSGHHLNFCGDCMGSPIRSEIWAALAPGDPALARELAYEDAIVDHDGEGIWGEIFLAVIESAAFVMQDRDRLIELGLSAIPTDCRTSQAVRATIDWFAQDGDWKAVRENILRDFGNPNFTDTPQNIAFTILGWLAGSDFGEAICIAVNCGQDTDCTGATLGALLGILDPASIPEKWLVPISDEVVLSSEMKNMHPPKTMQELTDLTVSMAGPMLDARSNTVRLTESETTPADLNDLAPYQTDPANSMLLTNDGLRIEAMYPNGLTFIPGKMTSVLVRFANRTEAAIAAEVSIDLPAKWQLNTQSAKEISLAPGESTKVQFNLTSPADLRKYREFLTLGISAGGVTAQHQLPLISAWPWTICDGDTCQNTWLPERMVMPNDLAKPNSNGDIKMATRFHFPRKQLVRIMLASNGSCVLTLDGNEMLNYKDGDFCPMPHRGHPGSFCDVELTAGWHDLGVSLTFSTDTPQAVLLLADGKDTLIIHDVTFSDCLLNI